MNQESITKNGITHIINFSRSARCDVYDNIEYLCFRSVAGRAEMARNLSDLDKAADFIEEARLSGGKAMSHCWYGKNRSVTVLIAYLMKYEGMSSKKANNLIKETRPQAAPYWNALKKYEKYLSEMKRE